MENKEIHTNKTPGKIYWGQPNTKFMYYKMKKFINKFTDKFNYFFTHHAHNFYFFCNIVFLI